MADMDTNWLQGALAALSACKIMWQVSLGQRFQTEMWVDFKLPDILRIEAAYMTDKQAVLLEEDGATWTIDVNTMTEANDTTGTVRKIRRIIVFMD